MYKVVTALPRWQQHQGRDFIFFDPHPGFAAGAAEHDWLHSWCQALNQSIQLVVDRAQRHYCPSPKDMPGLVPVPYVSPACLGQCARAHLLGLCPCLM